MTQTAPTAPTAEFSEKSFVAVGVTIGGLVVVTLICKVASVPQEVMGLVSGTAGLIPGAIAYGVQRRRGRAALASGAVTSWRPPPPALIAVLFALAIIVIDSLIGVLFTFGPTPTTVYVILSVFLTLVGAASGLLSFVLLRHPFLWVLLAVGIALALRIFILILFSADLAALDAMYPGIAANTVWGAVSGYLVMFAVAAIGVAISLGFRARYQARKLAGASTLAPVAAATPLVAPPSMPAVAPAHRAAEHAPPIPAAGWFPDPELRGIERWWDGANWTDQRRNTP